MNDILARWNKLPANEAADEILPCSGSKAWARQMAERRPFLEEAALLATCDKVWWALDPDDWLEAFRSHPRIGESAKPTISKRSAEWSSQEQKKAGTSDEAVKSALAEANRAYEKRFRRIFIVCASGKSSQEILAILQRRLSNDETTELQAAAEQQRQITQIRLKKWLHP
jgi:2-oxo-4-hydroxy-4-carboxy-5-ureidoimidazoline decarboxylase